MSYLSSLLIEEYAPIEQLELMPLFKEIVALRAVTGSPLKKFTLLNFELRREFELIESHATFVVKKTFLFDSAGAFRLEI